MIPQLHEYPRWQRFILLVIFSIHGCYHKWEVFQTIKQIDHTGNLLYFRYTLRCERCGAMKNHKGG